MIRITTLLACTLLMAPSQAQQQGRDDANNPQQSRVKKLSPRGFRKLRMSGEEVEANVKRLTKELRWHKSVSSTLAAARSKGRPALWIQALGDIDGYL